MINIPRLIVNVLLATSFFTFFITIFFFTYAKNIEKDITVKNLNYLVSNMTDNLVLLPPELKDELSNLISNMNLSVDKQQDINVEKGNSEIFYKAIKLYGTVCIINVVIAIIISRIYNIDLIESLFSNLNLLLVVIVTEYFFLTYIATDYISVDPNKVKRKFLDILQDK
jgi:hypothetical protein